MTLIERQISKLFFSQTEKQNKICCDAKIEYCKQIAGRISFWLPKCVIWQMRLNPNYKHNQQALVFFCICVWVYSTLSWTYAHRLLKSIEFLIYFFRGRQIVCKIQLSLIFIDSMTVGVCVFMFGFTSAWKRWTLIWRMFAKFMTNLMGKKPTNRLSQQRRQCFACACARYSVALLISVSVFFCVWLFLITFLARLWSRRDQIEKGYPTVDENWTHTKQVFVCEYGALYVHLCSMCIILDLCTATRLLHTIISFCITVSLSYAIYYILFFISFLVGIHTILV